MTPNSPLFPQSIALYRHLLRQIRSRLPPQTRGHYSHQARQGFVAFEDERDPSRIDEIVARATADAEWLVKKYSGWEEEEEIKKKKKK